MKTNTAGQTAFAHYERSLINGRNLSGAAEQYKEEKARRTSAGMTLQEWVAVRELFDYVTSEDCGDSAESRAVQSLCCVALSGDFEAAQKACAVVEGRLFLGDSGEWEMSQS